VLPDDTDVIVAVNSYVLGQQITTCKATAFAYRTDQADVIAWILAHARLWCGGPRLCVRRRWCRFEAAVQDADESVGELAQRRLVADVAVA
jgi:hypothetical protein